MTPTISTEIQADRYGNLLAEYQPRIIKTEEENDRFLAIVEDLMHRSSLSPEEDALLDLHSLPKKMHSSIFFGRE